MSKQSIQLQNIYTFGSGQLSECLKNSRQQNSKFPFMKNGKIRHKKTIQKVISQQRRSSKKKGHQKTDNLLTDDRHRVISCYEPISTFKLKDQNIDIENHGSNFQSCQKKKTSLPKIFKNLGSRNSSNKKTICSEGYLRYESVQENSDRPKFDESISNFAIRSVQDTEKRPKSMYFISEFNNEAYKQKLSQKLNHKTIPQKKTLRPKPVINMDNRIIENIKRLKEIYQ